MGYRDKVITRRDFLRTGACLSLGSLAGLSLPGGGSADTGKKSRVVLIRDKDVLDDRERIRPGNLEKMLDKAVATLLDSPSPAAAWKRLVNPGDRCRERKYLLGRPGCAPKPRLPPVHGPCKRQTHADAPLVRPGHTP
jgi:hypothetical protein